MRRSTTRNPSSRASREHRRISAVVLNRARSSRTLRAGDKEQIREELMNRTLLTRRTVLQTTAATALTAPFVHGACAAGRLSFGVWDHWVPGAAEVLQKICAQWGAK